MYEDWGSGTELAEQSLEMVPDTSHWNHHRDRPLSYRTAVGSRGKQQEKRDMGSAYCTGHSMQRRP